MEKVELGICQVNLLADLLNIAKYENYQFLRDYGFEFEIDNGFMEMWIDDLLENFCKPLILYDKDTEIILEG
jgi:hypothetical protein